MNPLLNLWLRMERGYGGRIGEQAVRATPALRGRSDREIQEIVAQFVKAAAEDPSHLEQFGIDPGEAIKNATGLEVSDEQMGDIVGAVEPLLEGKGLDMGKAMEAVGDFLGGDELLGKLSGLFGGK